MVDFLLKMPVIGSSLALVLPNNCMVMFWMYIKSGRLIYMVLMLTILVLIFFCVLSVAHLGSEVRLSKYFFRSILNNGD